VDGGPAMNTVQMIPVDQIDPHPHNPRRDLGDLVEFAASIKAQGIRQNLLLVPKGTGKFGDRYTAVIGHRRLAAAKLAGLTEVPAVVDADLTEAGQVELMLLENIQRTGLSPMEEAEGYQQLLDIGVTAKDIAKKTGRAQSTVTARIQLLKLSPPIRDMVHNHQATLEDAAELLKLEAHPAAMKKAEAALGTGNFKWTLDSARNEIKRAEITDPIVAELTSRGITKVGSDWWTHYNVRDRLDSLEALNTFAADVDLTGWAYSTGGYNGTGYVTMYEPKPGFAETAEEEGETAEEEQERRQRVTDLLARQEAERQEIQAEGEQAWESREAFVVAFSGRKRILAKESLAIVSAVAPLMLLQDDVWIYPARLAEWLGLANDDWEDISELVPVFDKACPSLDRSLCLLVLLHLSTRGARWATAYNDRSLVALYGLLEQLGYPVSDAERSRITPPPAAAAAEEDADA
jgi:ParB family transcriptional regulator, chromosome partitioning protein